MTEQAAAHLREELRKGRWTGLMPGRRTLARELGVSHNTVQEALNLLEAENILLPQGIGRRRRIADSKPRAAPALRVGILLYELADRKLDYTVDLRHELEAAGHIAMFAPKGLVDLGMNVQRVANLVGQTAADAWVVCSASREVLEWFAGRELPAFALFGRRRGVWIAGTGPDKLAAQNESLQRLVGLGHRRIVMLAREERRKPVPGQAEQAFLDQLAALGIPTGPYNLPDWEDHPEGLRNCLSELFRHTPPTALIVQVAPVFIAVQQYLANRGIVAPRDVSLICGDHDDAFAWCHPSISHIRWDSGTIPRRITRWVDRVAHGKDDRRQTFTKAEYVHGGTVGPVPMPAQR
ncbi:MAG TPA: substrate-binding domain-containing protein [Luteolibacter sp.]|nr:substrate-binding domain-containing protein [Luteolibacter sp.]